MMIDFAHKILLPQRPPHLVSRARLLKLFDAILDRSLITVSAPAGYGKTCLLIDFAHTATLPVCWYTLDTSDRDAWDFLAYLAAAIEYRFPGSMQQVKTLLAQHSRTCFVTASAALARDIYTIESDFVVMLDDWHLVDQVADITDVVTRLLTRCPNCHLILAARNYPTLPNIMLLTARRQMISINEQHLRFTPDEATTVLSTEYDTTVPHEYVTTLTDQANGWITGVLLSFQTSDPTIPETVWPEPSAERQIYRFLAEQVFDQQPQDVRDFLLDTALLEEITPDSCNAIFQRHDSRQYLETLLRCHLFITLIKPGVYRYHPLFREFLQEHYRTADPQRYSTMMCHIAGHYAAHHQWLLAFDCYIAAGEPAAARQIIAVGGEQLYATGRLNTLEHWFTCIAQEELEAPLLCLKARIMLERGRHQEAQTLAQLAELRVCPADKPLVMLVQAQIARILGRYETALATAEDILHITEDPAQRATALRTIAICHHRLGVTETAIQELNEALEIERDRGDLATIAQLHHDLTICYKHIGLLDVAETYCSYADAYWASLGNLGLRALSLNSKGNLQHLAGSYAAAHTTLTTALQYTREAAVHDYEAIVLSSLGDLYQDLQIWDKANTAYCDARKIGGSAYMMSYLDLELVRLLVRQRQFDPAERAFHQLPETTLHQHRATALWLSSSIACGCGSYDQAVGAVQQLITMLEPRAASIELARAYLLQARVAIYTSPFNEDRLNAALNRAVQIGTELRHDAFLIAEAATMPEVMRWATAVGWSHIEHWRQRQHSLLMTAQGLHHDDPRPVLVVQAFGQDYISMQGHAVKLGWNKAREVFYYLLAHPEGVPIDTLREAIWPDLTPARSGETLRSVVYQLRSVLPRELIELHRRRVYRLNRDAVRIDYDVEQFLHILDTQSDDSEAIFAALDMYHGSYLANIDNHWCIGMRTYLEQRYHQTLMLTATRVEHQHRFVDALLLYQRILELDNLDEAAHTGVMRCQVAVHNRAAAITQYQQLRHLLDTELGIDPGCQSEAEQLYRKLLTDDMET